MSSSHPNSARNGAGNGSSSKNNNNNPAPSRSDAAYTKSAGGMNNFMNSYGLKMHNAADVQEAKAIIDGFRKMDARAQGEGGR
ncbi:hypothetical protein MMC08_004700, partial [Hypocenomyce scalaris]|nr:hypothetical protein [Hypocenomyce scalaris]